MVHVKDLSRDVHKQSISIAVRKDTGKIVMECVIETKAGMILQFIAGRGGDVHVPWAEGTWAACWYDLLKPPVTKGVVCAPRRNALLREGNQKDRIDARKLAELLHHHQRRSVYPGEHGLRTWKELVRSDRTLTPDLSRVLSWGKAIDRRWAIPCSGKQVDARRHRAAWLAKISEPGVRRRAEVYYQPRDALRCLRQEVRGDLRAESQKHPAWKRLCGIPSLGPIRAAELLGKLQTRHRFGGPRQRWT
jgi:hypothetical protein